MVNANMQVLGQVLGISNTEDSLINLYKVLPNKIPLNKIKETLKNGFEKTFSLKLIKGSLTLKERYVAEKLIISSIDKNTGI